MRPAYRYEAIRLTAFVSLGVVVGLMSGHMAPSLLLVLLFYLGEHLFQLIRLIYSTDAKIRIKPPFPPGLWGEVYQVVSTHQSRSRKRKRGLVRFASRFREAAGAIPDALVILDKDLRVEWANPACLELLGFSLPSAINASINELIDYPKLHEYIEAGEYHHPVDFVPKHNNAIVLSLRVTPFGGKKRQRLLVARDITKIYHLNQIRRDFVANASHELRTPLTVINGFLENLIDTPATPENLQRPLNLMHSQADRMQSIIQDLLSLSRLEMDEKANDMDLVDVPHLLHAIVDEASSLGLEYKLELDADNHLWLMGNEGELHSAFSNLILNAVKHNPEGTRVRVIWHRNEQGPYLLVEDDGVGIDPTHLPRLSERFYRVDKGRSRASGGTGLGLAIVKHVLNRHDAQLMISSTPDNGSSFTCRFPQNALVDQERDALPTASA